MLALKEIDGMYININRINCVKSIDAERTYVYMGGTSAPLTINLPVAKVVEMLQNQISIVAN